MAAPTRSAALLDLPVAHMGIPESHANVGVAEEAGDHW